MMTIAECLTKFDTIAADIRNAKETIRRTIVLASVADILNDITILDEAA